MLGSLTMSGSKPEAVEASKEMVAKDNVRKKHTRINKRTLEVHLILGSTISEFDHRSITPAYVELLPLSSDLHEIKT